MSEEKSTNQENSNELSVDDLETVAGGCGDAGKKQSKSDYKPHPGGHPHPHPRVHPHKGSNVK